MNMDLGNSMTFAMVNGNANIIEIPTAFVKLSDKQAQGYFTDDIPKSQLKNSLMLQVDGEYLLVGEAAQKLLGNDQHIGEPHEKSTAKLSEYMFYAALAIHDAEESMNMGEDKEETTIQLDYFSTMLPIFEVLQGTKFSDKTNEMADRFKSEFKFKIATNGCEKTITVQPTVSKCYIEGLVATSALKYKFDLTENEVAEKFANVMTINNDIGGGTIDQVRLQKNLGKPKSRNDFKTITEAPFLGAVKELYSQKLRKYFKSTKEVEKFIVANYENESYVIEDGKTGEKTDLTEIVEDALREYTNAIMPIMINQFPSESGVKYKFNYFGGVAPILRKFIKEYVVNNYSEEVFENYHHIEPDRTARFLNLYGLEIESRHNTLVKK